MRSPKQRSRSKQNRPRTLGNITNRVFDSSGPEGKVRGTPQQIIEKYQVLARDAQLSNDRVAAENFQQHAEHYTRLLAQATREMQAEADARRIAHEEQQAQQARQRQQNDDRQPRQNGQQHRRADGDDSSENRGNAESFGFVQTDSDDTTLVETPEARMQGSEGAEDRSTADQRSEQRSDPRSDSRPEQRENRQPRGDTRGEGRSDPRPQRDSQSRDGQSRDGQPRENQPRENQPRRAPRAERAQQDPAPAQSDQPDTAQVTETGDAPASPKPRRNIRKPRKPAGDTPQGQDFEEPADPSRAAE